MPIKFSMKSNILFYGLTISILNNTNYHVYIENVFQHTDVDHDESKTFDAKRYGCLFSEVSTAVLHAFGFERDGPGFFADDVISSMDEGELTFFRLLKLCKGLNLISYISIMKIRFSERVDQTWSV